MSKNIKTVLIIFGSFLIIASVTLKLENSFKKTECIKTKGVSYNAVIQNNVIVPSDITAKLCDTLTIINADTVSRVMAFGKHESHISYAGTGETQLNKDQSLTIVLSQKGTYIFHDHNNEDLKGTFTVN